MGSSSGHKSKVWEMRPTIESHQNEGGSLCTVRILSDRGVGAPGVDNSIFWENFIVMSDSREILIYVVLPFHITKQDIW